MSVVPNLPQQRETTKQAETVKGPSTVREDLAPPPPEQLEIRRRARLAKWSQIITLVFVMLELAILFRVVLKLIAANSASPFAQFMYQMTGPFLAPFAGLTATPAVNGSVLEIPAIIGMAVYGVLYLLVIRIMWVTLTRQKRATPRSTNPI